MDEQAVFYSSFGSNSIARLMTPRPLPCPPHPTHGHCLQPSEIKGLEEGIPETCPCHSIFPQNPVLHCYCYHHPHLTDRINEAWGHQARTTQARTKTPKVWFLRPHRFPLSPHSALQRPQGHSGGLGAASGEKQEYSWGLETGSGGRTKQEPRRPARKVARSQAERQEEPPARKEPRVLSTS